MRVCIEIGGMVFGTEAWTDTHMRVWSESGGDDQVFWTKLLVMAKDELEAERVRQR